MVVLVDVGTSLSSLTLFRVASSCALPPKTRFRRGSGTIARIGAPVHGQALSVRFTVLFVDVSHSSDVVSVLLLRVCVVEGPEQPVNEAGWTAVMTPKGGSTMGRLVQSALSGLVVSGVGASVVSKSDGVMAGQCWCARPVRCKKERKKRSKESSETGGLLFFSSFLMRCIQATFFRGCHENNMSQN